MKDSNIQISMDVSAGEAKAFETFVNGLHTWWPKEYTWSKDKLVTIGIEAKVGGKCFEIGPENFQLHWGHVLAYEAPRRIVFRWQISGERVPEPDPEKASEIEVRFTAYDEGKTRVDFEHRFFQKHGERWEKYYEMMTSDLGWHRILTRFKDVVESS